MRRLSVRPRVIHVTMNDAPFETMDGKGHRNNEEIRSCMPGWRRAVLHGSQLRPPMTRHCHQLRLPINLINTHPFVPACDPFPPFISRHLDFTLTKTLDRLCVHAYARSTFTITIYSLIA